QIAQRAREVGRDDIARQAEQTWEDFDSHVAREAWDAATGCKRKCAESIWYCVISIGESADIQDQLFNMATDPLLDAVAGRDFPSPTSPSDLDTAALDAAVGAAGKFGSDWIRDSAGNVRGRQGLQNAARGAIDLAR